jgi:enamine deaminase RidA (YjgF/YER057c/UK114 family)
MRSPGIIVFAALLVAPGVGANAADGKVEYLNPKGLHQNPAFSQIAVVPASARTVYVGGQNSTDASGKVVSKGDLKGQTAKTIQNVETALAAAGAKLENVVKWNVHLVAGQPVADGAKVFADAWGKRPNPPTVTVLVVSGLANPDFLVEIDAVAVVP